MERFEFQWTSGKDDMKEVSGAQVTGTPMGLEIVFWSRVEAQTTWSASPSHRPRLTWPPIGENSYMCRYLHISDQLMWCRFIGMTTSVFWAWVITTFSSTTPLTRSHSSFGIRYLYLVFVFSFGKDLSEILFQACDSVLPFQILYDEGVITGFVWQVTSNYYIYHFISFPHWEYLERTIAQAFCSTLHYCLDFSDHRLWS